MIRAGAALSHTEETEEAAEEATLAALERAGMDEADWVLLFATPHHRPAYSRMLGAAAATAGTHRIIGCSGVGVLTHEGEIESGPGISVLVVASDTVRASPFLLQTLDHWSGLAGIRREEETRDASDLVVLLPDPVGAPIESLLRTIERSIGGVSIVGAAPSEDGTLGGTYQFCGEEAVSGGVAGIHLSGGFETTIGVTQACQPIGEPCIITRSAGGTVHQLDGRPAFTVLRDQLPRPLADDLASALPYISAGVAAGHGGSVERGEYLVRNIVAIDAERGAIRLAGRVRDGEVLCFTLYEGGRAREDLKRMLERVAPRRTGRNPSFGLYFNCAARGSSLYRLAGVDTAFLGSRLPGVPIAGFFGNAEIGPMAGANRILTYTGVLALISEAG